jgi:two-component system LytT family response regulator
MKMRVLIADDEPLARERVGTFLAGESDIKVVGEAGDGLEAVNMIRELRPDLVFLDVQMPGAIGLNVLRDLKPEERPQVIFVTAHDKYAVEAFEVRATDYLLKPLKAARFKEALARAREAWKKSQKEGKRTAPDVPETKSYLSRIPVRQNGRVTFVPVKEISHVEAAGNYLTLHTARERHMVRETLSNLEAQLAPGTFVRISRSALVNVNAIKEIQPSMPGEHVMLLRAGESLPVTRAIRELEEVLRFA